MKSMRLVVAVSFIFAVPSLAAAQAPTEGKVFQQLFPNRNKCVDIVQLEKLPIESDGYVPANTSNVGLVIQYAEVVGWLEGYFTATNMYDSRTTGDITMGTKGREWMVWIFNYCKSNPWATLSNAGYELSKVLLNRRNGKSGQ